MSRWIRRSAPAGLAAALLAAVLGTLATAAVRQTRQDPFRIQVQVEAVNLGVAVTDERGRFVSGLTADDFVVREDGVPQQIRFFAAEAAPPVETFLNTASPGVLPGFVSIVPTSR